MHGVRAEDCNFTAQKNIVMDHPDAVSQQDKKNKPPVQPGVFFFELVEIHDQVFHAAADF